jgi:hypothetical protein
MATYTIDTSAAEEKGLNYVVAERNAARAAEVPPKPALTNAEYLDQILVRRSLLAFRDQMKAAEAREIKDAYEAANNATQASVRAALGL